MKLFALSMLALNTFLVASLWSVSALAQAKVMNPGEAIGQLVYLSAEDVRSESAKYKSLSPFSIPVFEDLPMDLAVVAGTITIAQQNLLSHVQIKARARKTPNLDISELSGGIENELFREFNDGDWIRMELGREGTILLEASNERAATEFYDSKVTEPVELLADLSETRILRTEDLGWQDFDIVGSKAANYAELAKVLNTPERMVVPLGYAIPFYHYNKFIQDNPLIADAIARMIRDPLMKRVARVEYREAKLEALREMILSEDAVINEELIDDILFQFEQKRGVDGLPVRLRLRSSTNAEDLANFNGAGLYTSDGYAPVNKDGEERSEKSKRRRIRESLQIVWSSVWNLRAYEERDYFQIPHDQVMMGVQVNPSFRDEFVDGVVISKNVSGDPELTGRGVYIEAQRGDEHSVANPLPGVSPEKVLVLVDDQNPLDMTKYEVHVLQQSNIADDMTTVLDGPNPKPVMSDDEVIDLAFQVLKAEVHFKPLLGADNPNFSLDLEFKVDGDENGDRFVHLKQSRPFID